MSWRSIGVSLASSTVCPMTTPDRRPPTDHDTTVGLVAILTMAAFLTWGLPLAIVLWRAAL